jgi:regulatory protein
MKDTDAGGSDAVEQARTWLARRGVHPAASPVRPSRWTENADQDSVFDSSLEGVSEPPPRRERPSRLESAPTAGDDDPDTDPDAEDVARSIVLRKLSAQARTRQELSKAMKAKNVPDDVGSAVLDRMEDVGLVDDAEFAREWVRSRQSRRYLSRTALRRELNSKGVAKDQIDSALETVDGEDEYAAALALAQKKLRSMAGLQHEVQYRRLAGALARRGFGSGTSSKVLAEVLHGQQGG